MKSRQHGHLQDQTNCPFYRGFCIKQVNFRARLHGGRIILAIGSSVSKKFPLVYMKILAGRIILLANMKVGCLKYNFGAKIYFRLQIFGYLSKKF